MVVESYNKARKVVKSCKDLTQLKYAKKYIDLFYFNSLKLLPLYLFSNNVGDMLLRMRADLLFELYLKEKTLKKSKK